MAGSLNKVMLIGRLGRDPELRYTNSGSPVVNFSMATDESYNDRNGQRQEKTEWHRVVVWGRQAENCNNYLSKGSLVYVEGSLQTEQWQDQQGQTRYTTKVNARRVQFLEARGQGQGQGQGQGYQDRPPQGQQPPRYNDNYGPPREHGPMGPDDDDMGPAFPSEAGGMDDVPF